MQPTLPAWCRWRAGAGHVLVVAPHGGLCARDLLAPRGAGALRGNDIHTADVACELAARLDASLLANVALDRNELDLNRVDEVAARAPWFLAALDDAVARILARHPVAQVLFVHGWHVVQAQCDVGIGARLATPGDAGRYAARLTVPPGYVAGPLATLAREAARADVRTTLGERWPAAHRNNVMQLLRAGGRAEAGMAGAALRARAASGRVRAVQLELGAPLRWPGRWREGFLAAAEAAFAQPHEARGDEAVDDEAGRDATPGEELPGAGMRDRDGDPGRAPSQPGSARPADAGAIPARFALQAHDPAAGEAGLGLVVGVGPLTRDELGARLLLLPGGQRMLLFTGHARVRPGDGLRVGGLAVASRDGGVEVRFSGPVLDVPDAHRHFACEPAQLDASVAALDVALRFVPSPGGWGAVNGYVVVDGRVISVAAHGFSEPVLARPAVAPSGRATRLTASFGSELGLTLDLPGHDAAGTMARVTAGGRETRPLPAWGPGSFACDALPAPFAVPLGDEPPLECTPCSHVTVLRPAGDGRLAQVTFGTAVYRLADGPRGSGFYEHTTTVEARVSPDGDP